MVFFCVAANGRIKPYGPVVPLNVSKLCLRGVHDDRGMVGCVLLRVRSKGDRHPDIYHNPTLYPPSTLHTPRNAQQCSFVRASARAFGLGIFGASTYVIGTFGGMISIYCWLRSDTSSGCWKTRGTGGGFVRGGRHVNGSCGHLLFSSCAARPAVSKRSAKSRRSCTSANCARVPSRS